MAAVYHLLSARLNKSHDECYSGLERTIAVTATKHRVEWNHQQTRSIFDALGDITKSRRKAQERLYDRGLSMLLGGRSENEMAEIRKKLADDPRRVLTVFQNRIINSDVGLDDPQTLAAFKAATEILGYCLQLEHDYMRAYLEAARTHLRLKRRRRAQPAPQHPQSKEEPPQTAEGPLLKRDRSS
jgi:hypothetical protein